MITKTAAIAAINATKITRGYKEIVGEVINEIEDSHVVLVKSCTGCPMSEDLGNSDWCNHPNYNHTINHKYSTFEGCPLKTNSLTIQLEQQ